MFPCLIIYFMLVVSLGQIFHLNSFKNPFCDFTHAIINNAFLVLMSSGWVWENLIKVQAGFTSFLNAFRTFLNIFYLFIFLMALSQDFEACYRSRPLLLPKKSLLSQITVTFLSQSLDSLWNLTKPHTVWQETQRDICFALYHLATCPPTLA